MAKEYQESSIKKLLRKGDKIILRVPVLDHPITINEIHAFQLGLLGLFVGMTYNSGLEAVASGVAMLIVGYAIIGDPIFKSMSHDNPEYKTIGMRTIKHEPWWFTVPFTVAFLISATGMFKIVF